MAESQEERNERVSKRAVEDARKFTEEQQKWADENRADQEVAPESEEEALERVNAVRRSMAFGDMPSDPTTGDPQVVVNDFEGASVSQAEADAAAQAGDEEAQSQDLLTKQRQDAHGLDEEELAAAADSEPESTEDGTPTGKSEGQAKKDEGEKTETDKVKSSKSKK
jgi:hypothetical protein